MTRITDSSMPNPDDPQWEDRVTDISYDSRTGFFPYQITNPMGHMATLTYEPSTGALARATDPNGLTESFKYDGFVRPRSHTRIDGNYVSTSCRGTLGTNALPLVVTITPESGDSSVEYDSLERPVVTTVPTFSGGTASATRSFGNWAT